MRKNEDDFVRSDPSFFFEGRIKIMFLMIGCGSGFFFTRGSDPDPDHPHPDLVRSTKHCFCLECRLFILTESVLHFGFYTIYVAMLTENSINQI